MAEASIVIEGKQIAIHREPLTEDALVRIRRDAASVPGDDGRPRPPHEWPSRLIIAPDLRITASMATSRFLRGVYAVREEPGLPPKTWAVC